MPLDPVALVHAKSYAQAEEAVGRAFSLLGGLGQCIRPGMRVFLKPNLMRKCGPEAAATTHPAVVSAVAKAVLALGATPIIGDSPGGALNHGILKGVYEATGMQQVAKETGALLNFDCTAEEIPIGGKKLNKCLILSAIAHADAVINIAKLKSHTLATYSGAAKNLYGVVPGLRKAEMHFQFQKLEDFSHMLVDIEQYVHPVLHIIDGIIGMEGEGPGAGVPVPIGAIVAAQNAFAADDCAIRLVGFSREEIPLLRAAEERGLLQETEILGDGLFLHENFVRANSADNRILKKYLPEWLITPAERMLALKPKIQKEKCVGCGVCSQVCPVHAATIAGKKASINRKTCIYCFCCMEFCKYHAISARRPWVFRAAIRITSTKEGRG